MSGVGGKGGGVLVEGTLPRPKPHLFSTRTCFRFPDYLGTWNRLAWTKLLCMLPKPKEHSLAATSHI